MLPGGVARPRQGFVVAQSSFGYVTEYVFDARSGLLTGIWADPDLPGSGAAPPMPEKHAVKLPEDERTALVKLINRAWAPRRPSPGPATTHEVAITVWLLDGARSKALDGYRGGQVINAAIIPMAEKHGVVRDNRER
jgi:hypothetical protein